MEKLSSQTEPTPEVKALAAALQLIRILDERVKRLERAASQEKQ